MNLYDVLAWQGTTHFERLFSRMFAGGGKTQTLTGIPPLSFKADGKPLIGWSMKGNGSQSGTPTPDNPVMPTFCGVRTGNLFYSDRTNHNTTSYSVIDQTEGSAEFVISKTETSSAVALFATINLPLRAGTYTISVDGLSFIAGNLDRINLRYSGGVVVNNVMSGSPQTFTIDTDTVVTAVAFICDSTSTYTNKKVRIMLTPGSTALTYEPYGYKIPLTCAGQTTPLYLGDVSTVRRVKKVVFDGTESWTENTSGENTFSARLALSQANINSAEGYCSHLPFVATGISQDRPLAGCYNSAAFLRFDRNMVDNITEFKSYLASEYSAGRPVIVWYVLAEPTTGIVNEPIMKIGDYADELTSTTPIPTAKGDNTLTVDTDLQPSEMTITYKG